MDERRTARQRRRQQNQRAVAGTSLFLLGLVLGLVGGLYYAWVVNSGETNTAVVAVLRPSFKEDYLFMVSQSYAATGNWEQTTTRLARLDDPVIDETVVALLEQYLREGRPAEQVRNLAQLAEQLGAESPVLALFAPTPAPITAVTPDNPNGPSPTATATLLPTPTASVAASATPSPTSTPPPLPSATPTAVPDYRLLQQEQVCQADPTDQARLEVIVVDANLQPLPGVEIIISWGDGNTDRFFTGFKPQKGLGYADFVLVEGVSYTVSIVGGSEPVSGLQTTTCPNGEGLQGWLLRFQNLAVDQQVEAATATAEANATITPSPEASTADDDG